MPQRHAGRKLRPKEEGWANTESTFRGRAEQGARCAFAGCGCTGGLRSLRKRRVIPGSGKEELKFFGCSTFKWAGGGFGGVDPMRDEVRPVCGYVGRASGLPL